MCSKSLVDFLLFLYILEDYNYMDFVNKKDPALLPLKVIATICFGRYSGLVSYHLSEEKHPKDVEFQSKEAFLPTTAVFGGLCSMSTFFIVHNRDKYKHIYWLIIGSIPIIMSISRPVCQYCLFDSPPSKWYRFKTFHSIIALAVFSFCTFRLAIEYN